MRRNMRADRLAADKRVKRYEREQRRLERAKLKEEAQRQNATDSQATTG